MVLESADFYRQFYDENSSVDFGLWAAVLNEVFLVIMSAVWLPAISKGTKKVFHPGNLLIKVIMLFLFINTVGGASLNVIQTNLTKLQEEENRVGALESLKQQLESDKEAIKAFVDQKQRTNTAIAAKNLREINNELRQLEMNKKSVIALWLDILMLFILRFTIQLANITTIWLASWLFRQPIGGLGIFHSSNIESIQQDIKSTFAPEKNSNKVRAADSSLVVDTTRIDTTPENLISEVKIPEIMNVTESSIKPSPQDEKKIPSFSKNQPDLKIEEITVKNNPIKREESLDKSSFATTKSSVKSESLAHDANNPIKRKMTPSEPIATSTTKTADNSLSAKTIENLPPTKSTRVHLPDATSPPFMTQGNAPSLSIENTSSVSSHPSSASSASANNSGNKAKTVVIEQKKSLQSISSSVTENTPHKNTDAVTVVATSPKPNKNKKTITASSNTNAGTTASTRKDVVFKKTVSAKTLEPDHFPEEEHLDEESERKEELAKKIIDYWSRRNSGSGGLQEFCGAIGVDYSDLKKITNQQYELLTLSELEFIHEKIQSAFENQT